MRIFEMYCLAFRNISCFNNQMQRKILNRWLVALIFVMLLAVADAQRGGSRSSSSSSSRSSSSSSRYRSSSYHYNQNCTVVNGTKTCTYVQQQLSWTVIFIIIGVFIVIIVIAVISAQKDEQRRKKVIDGAMKDYQARMEEWPSTLDEQQKSALIDTFMKRSYTMVINIRDKSEKFYCQVKVTDLKKENDWKYSIKLTGKDEVGTSKLEGVLIFRSDGIGLKLSKVYDERSKAEQTGKFQNLLYEGAGTADKIDGEWAFVGYETSTEYAGSWSMLEI